MEVMKNNVCGDGKFVSIKSVILFNKNYMSK